MAWVSASLTCGAARKNGLPFSSFRPREEARLLGGFADGQQRINWRAKHGAISSERDIPAAIGTARHTYTPMAGPFTAIRAAAGLNEDAPATRPSPSVKRGRPRRGGILSKPARGGAVERTDEESRLPPGRDAHRPHRTTD